jgi:NAD(P) transhydrogenase
MEQAYELVVLGSGPGGQRAAVQAAKLGKKVLLVERERLGGGCLHTGTIPSKTLREAALEGRMAPERRSLEALMLRKGRVIEAEMQIVDQQLSRNGVETAQGTAQFRDHHSLEIYGPSGMRLVRGDFIVIATGTRPRRPAEFDFTQPGVYDSDTILGLPQLPSMICVMGAGVVGCEYVSVFAEMGCKVALVDHRRELLRGVDREVVDRLTAYMGSRGVSIHLGPACIGPDCVTGTRAADGRVNVQIEEKTQCFDALLYCMGRVGNVEELHLSKAGLEADARGLIKVNEHFQTAQPHIYAVGDVLGAPALAAAAFEQGRLAAAHAFGIRGQSFPKHFPYGIYTIPEISSVGVEESELQSKGQAYVVGKARYSELARGKIIGDDYGFLKLLFDRTSRKLVGAHIIGTNASELVHIAQVAISLGADVHALLGWVFNYPTLAEAYKVAALNAYNQFDRSPAP